MKTQSIKFVLGTFIFFSLFLPIKSVLAEVNPSYLIDLTNKERVNLGLSTLKENHLLTIAAQAKANDMASKGYFSHNAPDGRTPWTFIENTGYQYVSAGENLAVDFFESESIMRAWMNSPGHRANIVKAEYVEIGIAFQKGMYRGHETIFVVQMFGIPKNGVKVIEPLDSYATNQSNSTEPSLGEVKPVALPTQKPIHNFNLTPKEIKPVVLSDTENNPSSLKHENNPPNNLPVEDVPPQKEDSHLDLEEASLISKKEDRKLSADINKPDQENLAVEEGIIEIVLNSDEEVVPSQVKLDRDNFSLIQKTKIKLAMVLSSVAGWLERIVINIAYASR